MKQQSRRLPPAVLQLRRWQQALGIARILFESEGYHCLYLDQIAHFIEQHYQRSGGPTASPEVLLAKSPPGEPSALRVDRYPSSRFWAVYDGDELVAVTVYRRGAREVLRRLQALQPLTSTNGSAPKVTSA
jgi:hypothetical protein